jgi:hypothetical protein
MQADNAWVERASTRARDLMAIIMFFFAGAFNWGWMMFCESANKGGKRLSFSQSVEIISVEFLFCFSEQPQRSISVFL